MPNTSGIVGILKTLITVDPSQAVSGFRTASAGAVGFTGVMGKLGDTVGSVADGLIDVTGLLTKVGSSVSAFGRQWTLGVSLPLAGTAGLALKFATDFQASTTKLGTLADVASGQVETMRQRILELAPAVGIGPQALSEALLVVTSTGMRGAGALDVLTKSAQASAIGLGDTRDVANAVTAAMNAYGQETLSAAQATDILVQSVVEGKAEASEFAPQIGRVVGLAAQMGVSFAQVGAFVATFTRLGVDADTATTALTGTLNNILSPADQVKKALTGVGLSAEGLRQAIRERGLADTLIDLIERFRDAPEKLGDVIPNVRALAGVLGTAGSQAEAFRDILANIENSTGVTSRKFGEASTTMAFSLAALRARVEAIAIAFGQQLAPAFNVILSAAKPLLDLTALLVRAFAALPGPIQTVALAVVGLTIALGPLLLVMSSLVKTLSLFATLATLNTLLGLATGQVAATALASTGLSGALSALVGWFTRLAPPVLAVAKHFLTVGNAARYLWGIITGGVALFVRLGPLLLNFIPGPGWFAKLALIIVGFQTFRGVIADVISIGTSLVRIMATTIGVAFDNLVTKIREQFAELGKLHEQFRASFPLLATLEDAALGAAQALHETAVSLKQYADQIAISADETERMIEAAQSVGPAAKSMKEFWDSAAKQGLGPAADASMLLSMQLGHLGQVVNDQSANALAKLTRELEANEAAAKALSETERAFLILAIREGTLTVQEMADAIGTSTGAVETFKKKLQEAASAADSAANKFKQLRDKMSGKDALTEAQNYERMLKAIGGATRLTGVEAEEVIKAFDAVIAKYRQLGGAEGARVVAHFTALRAAMSQTDAAAQEYLENEKRGYEASQMAIEEKDRVAQEYLASELIRLNSLDLIAQEYLDNEKRGWEASIIAIEARDEAGQEFLRTELARMAALKGTKFEDPFTKEMEAAAKRRQELIDTVKSTGEQLQRASIGGLGTLFFGQLGHDITGELRSAADEAHLEFLRLQRSGRATAKELTIAFERWREAEDRANFTFGERWAQLWGGIKQTTVRILDEILSYFVRHFIAGLVRAIGAARLAERLGGALGGLLPGLAVAGQGPIANIAGTALLSGGGAGAAAGFTTINAAGVAVTPGLATAGGIGGGGAAGTGAGIGLSAGTIAATGGLAAGALALYWGIRHKGLFRGGEEATKVSPRRDKFQLQFGSISDTVAEAGMKLAALLTRLTGAEGGGPLFRAMQMADRVKEFEAAQSAIVRTLTQHGQRGVRMFQFGGVVSPGATQLAVLHGGPRGEVVAPMEAMARPIEVHQHYSVSWQTQAMDSTDFARAFKNEFLPRLHQEFELNQQSTLTRLKRAWGET